MTPSDPSRLFGKTNEEYRQIFYETYCLKPIRTFDGLEVRFNIRDYDHAFKKSTDRRRTGEKTHYDTERQERVLWIKHVLESDNCDLRFGWDSKKRIVLYDRRVAMYRNKYVVVIRTRTGSNKANFITAFIADDAFGVVNTIKQSEIWYKK